MDFPEQEYNSKSIQLKGKSFLRSMWRALNWKDQAQILLDPYQFLICHIDEKECQRLSLSLIYGKLLYLIREQKFLSNEQVAKTIEIRDNLLLSFNANKYGQVAAIYNNTLYFNLEGSSNLNGRSSYGLGMNSHSQQQYYMNESKIEIIENLQELRMLVPSPKFSEIFVGATRKNLLLLRKIKDQLEIIKEYANVSAEIGAFSKDGKYFVAGNSIQSSIKIIDLFSHLIYERNSGNSGISSIQFSPSGLHALSVCSKQRTISIYECILWEKQTFHFNEDIVFSDFLQYSEDSTISHYQQQRQEQQKQFQAQISNSASGIVVLLRSGQVLIIRDMQFNTLTNVSSRINFQIIELELPTIEQIPSRFIQTQFVNNILFYLSQDEAHEQINLSYLDFSKNQVEPTIVNFPIQLTLETRIDVIPKKIQSSFSIQIYSFDQQVSVKVFSLEIPRVLN